MPCTLSLLPKSGGLVGCSFQRSCRYGPSVLEYSAPSHALTHTHPLSSSLLPLSPLSHTRARAHTHTHPHPHIHTYTQVTERGRQSRTRVRDSRQAASARAHLSPAWHTAPRTALAASRAQRWESAPGLGSGYPSARPLVSRAVVPPARFCLSAPGTAPRFQLGATFVPPLQRRWRCSSLDQMQQS